MILFRSRLLPMASSLPRPAPPFRVEPIYLNAGTEDSLSFATRAVSVLAAGFSALSSMKARAAAWRTYSAVMRAASALSASAWRCGACRPWAR
jgi:hypothetical protein